MPALEGCLVLGGLVLGGVWSWGCVCLLLGGVCSRGSGRGGCLLQGEGVSALRGVLLPGNCLVETPPGRPLLRAVRILLECILVCIIFAESCMKMKKKWTERGRISLTSPRCTYLPSSSTALFSVYQTKIIMLR